MKTPNNTVPSGPSLNIFAKILVSGLLALTLTSPVLAAPPVADAGSAQTVDEGTTVTLDGSNSSDADGDTLTYAWTGPQGVTLSDASLASPTFTAPQVDGVSAGSLPNITGLVGHYTAASFNDTDNEWNDLWHVFQIEAVLPESIESFKMFGNFLNKHIGVKV